MFVATGDTAVWNCVAVADEEVKKNLLPSLSVLVLTHVVYRVLDCTFVLRTVVTDVAVETE